MGNNKLSEDDLILILKKKLSILHEWLQLSQRQLVTIEDMDALLLQKDQCLEALIRVDGLTETWQKQNPRTWNEKEVQLQDQIRQKLQEILDSEQATEEKLMLERGQLSLELKQLREQSSLKNYLNSAKKVPRRK
ncbi:MAG: hypothetical protein HQM11_02285 [SAR324 cluster bacterium]|nr:hypothetical protein [SAR324 cluster bacterium]